MVPATLTVSSGLKEWAECLAVNLETKAAAAAEAAEPVDVGHPPDVEIAQAAVAEVRVIEGVGVTEDVAATEDAEATEDVAEAVVHLALARASRLPSVRVRRLVVARVASICKSISMLEGDIR